MEESRKHALVFVTALLTARRLAGLGYDEHNMRRKIIIQGALEDAELILETVEARYTPEAIAQRRKEAIKWGHIKPTPEEVSD